MLSHRHSTFESVSTLQVKPQNLKHVVWAEMEAREPITPRSRRLCRRNDSRENVVWTAPEAVALSSGKRMFTQVALLLLINAIWSRSGDRHHNKGASETKRLSSSFTLNTRTASPDVPLTVNSFDCQSIPDCWRGIRDWRGGGRSPAHGDAKGLNLLSKPQTQH
jgi:hypothetical protein